MSMKGGDFVFDCGNLLYYKCLELDFKRGRLYRFCCLDKKLKSNNKSYQEQDHKCFQYAVTVGLNDEEIKKDFQRTLNT